MIQSFLIDFFKSNRKTWIIYFMFVLLYSGQRIITPHFYGKIVSNLNDQNNSSATYFFFCLIGAWILFQIFDIIVTFLESKLLPRLQNTSRQYLFQQILYLFRENFQELELGNITSKIIKFPEAIRDIFYRIKNFFFTHFLGSLLSLLYIFFQSYKLGLVVLASYLVILCLCGLFMTRCSSVAFQRENVFDKTQEEIQDTLLNLLTIYTSSNESNEVSRISYFNHLCEQFQVKSIRCVNFYRALYALLFIFIFVMYNCVSYYLYTQKEISISALTSIFILTYMLVGNLSNFMNDTNGFIYAWTKLKSVLDYIKNISFRPSSASSSASTATERNLPYHQDPPIIEFHHVSYKDILKDVSFSIVKGEHVAIMGKIGSGKSTLVYLLCRLLPLSNGSITLFQQSITEYSLAELRSFICYIPQNPKLFNRTLFENLNYGLPEPQSEENIVHLLQKYHLSDLIPFFQEKMHKSVGKLGSFLSGGQRQIVWILKSILGNYPIIILDEPTASLDEDHQEQFYHCIRSLRKTILIISHDKDIVPWVDRIYSFQEGRFVSQPN